MTCSFPSSRLCARAWKLRANCRRESKLVSAPASVRAVVWGCDPRFALSNTSSPTVRLLFAYCSPIVRILFAYCTVRDLCIPLLLRWVGRTHVVSAARYVEMFSQPELDVVVTKLAEVQQASFQRRSVRAAERTVYKDDYDEEELEVEEGKDANEEELAYHVRASGAWCRLACGLQERFPGWGE